MRWIVFGWLLLTGVLTAGSCPAQCPGETAAIVDSGYSCSGDTLAVVASGPISQIVWYKDGQVVKTATASSIVSPVAILAGGNGYGAAANQFDEPIQIAVDDNGYLYVSDRNNVRVQRFPPGSTSRTNGTTVAVSPIRDNDYDGLCIDSKGNIYVSDLAMNAVQRFAPGATLGVTVAGGHGAGAGDNQINTPGMLFIDAAGDLYVVDEANLRVQEWTPGASSGVTVAGAFTHALSEPSGIAVDDAGQIYIS